MTRSLKFFVIGEKGGVGKTWFTFILIEFLRQIFKQIPTIVDMDTSTPNIAKTYCKKIYAQWSNSSLGESSTSRIFEPAAESESESEDIPRIDQLLQNQISLTNDREGLMGDKLLEILDISTATVVAMPSQSQQWLCEWLERYLTKVEDEQDQDQSGLACWWVSDGSFESLQLFDKFICQYPPSDLIQYCLVINKGSRDIDWGRYKLVDIYPDILQLVTAGEIKAIEIEKMGFEPSVLRQVQEQGLSFSDILSNNPKTNQFFLNRFDGWLKRCYTQIRTTGYVPEADAAVSAKLASGIDSDEHQIDRGSHEGQAANNSHANVA
jgi:hypothetical protein